MLVQPDQFPSAELVLCQCNARCWARYLAGCPKQFILTAHQISYSLGCDIVIYRRRFSYVGQYLQA